MYVPNEEQISIAEELNRYFLEGNMVNFAKCSAELYQKYGEFTADDIMRKVKINTKYYLTTPTMRMAKSVGTFKTIILVRAKRKIINSPALKKCLM